MQQQRGLKTSYKKVKITIHFDFEGFQPLEMFTEDQINYYYFKMCPPKRVFYWYSINGKHSLS